ncbi:MAG: hypothetical protein PHG82_04765 [Candidatus Gracilibacteria bacterium]|nr:hypothetical protein [Candidatus Gracilibacteria bacterium]
MEALLIIIGIVSIINFFLFKKAVKKENLELKNSSINLAYFFVFIFQALIISFLAISFLNVFASIALSLLLYFNLIYLVSSKLLKNIENKKDLATTITIRFLKYLVIFEGSIAVLIGAIYVFSLLISKI